jgi:hypothetical protein
MTKRTDFESGLFLNVLTRNLPGEKTLKSKVKINNDWPFARFLMALGLFHSLRIIF